jgi:hypothetical protein
MRVEVFHFRIALLAFVFCLLICGAPILGGQPTNGDLPASASEAPPVHMTLVFYSQHRLPEGTWAALFAAVQANLPEAAAEVPALDPHAELVRGDALERGALVPQSVNVYLHGDCYLYPMPRSLPGGQALGWVVKDGTKIEPVIHVECTQIGDELSHRAAGMTASGRTAAMSEAMARVILHEWAHVATQSSAHGAKGITKARFGVDDLVLSGRQAQVGTANGR